MLTDRKGQNCTRTGEMWLKVAPPGQGYVQLSDDGSGIGQRLEREMYRIGVNGYSQEEWDAHFANLVALKHVPGDTLVYLRFLAQAVEREENSASHAAAVQSGDSQHGMLYKWVRVQQELYSDGLLPGTCVEALDRLGFNWDASKGWLFGDEEVYIQQLPLGFLRMRRMRWW